MRSRGLGLLAVLLAAFGAVSLLWPGDVSFLGDEAELLRLASGGAGHGLAGRRGVMYGGFAVWVYRALLALTHDLTALVVLRSVLFLSATGAAIVWLAASCASLYPPLGACAFLSTYLWFYARGLWDNTFLIPLSWLAVAAYASFEKSPKPWKLALAGALGAAMLLTHLMCLPVLGAFALHAAWRHGRWLKARTAGVAGGLLVLAAVCAQYLASVASGPRPAPPPHALSWWQGWVFPWLGGRVFSAWGLEYFFGGAWSWGKVQPAAWATFAAVPLVWAGLAASLRKPKDSPEFHVALVGAIALFFQSVLYGTMRLYGHPHYYDPLWPFYFHYLWLALSAAPRAGALAAGQLAPAAVLAAAIGGVHAFGGTRS
ncbi:MAG: hypothetical protein HY925_00405, partial [Elusimicrobia bacterium]|nr:hypothetical protein [Elusimicrobiota bacterium]